MSGGDMALMLVLFPLAAFALFALAGAFGGWLPTRSLPGCYGSQPGPQQRAENDCIACEWHTLCLRGPCRFTREEIREYEEGK